MCWKEEAFAEAERHEQKGQENDYQKTELETVCGITSRLPEKYLPGFAFATKSNVGKSSLINGLLTGSLWRELFPAGKTRPLIFTTSTMNCILLIFPGYGYAKVSVEVKAKTDGER